MDAQVEQGSCAPQQQHPDLMIPLAVPRHQNESERVRALLTILNRVLPSIRRALPVAARLAEAREVLPRQLGEAPQYDLAEEPAAYCRRLLQWGAPPGAALDSCFVQLGGRTSLSVPAMHAAGCFPHRWSVPLTAEGVQAANRAAARVAAADPQSVAREAVKARGGRSSAATSSRASGSNGAVALAGGGVRAGQHQEQRPAPRAASASRLQHEGQRHAAQRAGTSLVKKRTLDDGEAPCGQGLRAKRPAAAGATGRPRAVLQATLPQAPPGTQAAQIAVPAAEHLAGAAAAAADAPGRARRPRPRERGQRAPAASSAAEQQLLVTGAAATAASEPAELPRCRWFDRQPHEGQNLGRDARQHRDSLKAKTGLDVLSCHDCQEPHYALRCTRGPCGKSYCIKCLELYRYLLSFGLGHPQYALRRDFCAGTCPCCLRVCVRKKCRAMSLAALGGQAPEPSFSEGQLLVFAHHLAHKLLPAVEAIMALHAAQAAQAGVAGGLAAVPLTGIGFLADGTRAPHSERVLCDRCGTSLENLHFHCPAMLADGSGTEEECGLDLCPSCVRDQRLQQRGAKGVMCPSCGAGMQPLRFLQDDQQEALLQARQRLDAALGRSSGATAAARALGALCGPFGGAPAGQWRVVCNGEASLGRLRAAAEHMETHAAATEHQQKRREQQQQQQELAEQGRRMLQGGRQGPPWQAQAQAVQRLAAPPAYGAPLPALLQTDGLQQPVPAAHLLVGSAPGAARPANGSSVARTPAELQQQQQRWHQQQCRQQRQQEMLARAHQPQHGALPPLVPLQQQQHPGVAQGQLPWELQHWQQQHVAQPGHLWQQPQGVPAVPVPLMLPGHEVLQNGAAPLAAAPPHIQPPLPPALPAPANGTEEPRPVRQRKVSHKLLESQQSAQWLPEELQMPDQRPAHGAAAGSRTAAAPSRPPDAAAAPLAEPSAEERCQRQWWWMREGLDESEVRLASDRGEQGGGQDFLWTPHVSQFDPAHQHYARTMRLFQMLWSRGEPIIVRGLSGQMGWTPEGMARVCKEANNSKLNVVDCKTFLPDHDREVTPREFFALYKACSGDTRGPDGKELSMLKLKDFPPSSDFKSVLARHHDDFVAMLTSCMPAYSHPTHGPLNLATLLPWYTRLPDLGPKGYIAFGREEEHEGEGDSVTKMHEDLSDAVNIMMHTQHREGVPRPPPRSGWTRHDPADRGYRGAGAVWDLVRRQDRPALRRFFEDALDGKVPGCPPFRHKGEALARGRVHDVIHDQCFMLAATHRRLLRERYGVHVWHFEQYEWEAVWIPGGCPHQVRNLRSAIKVALDFVSPEAVTECMQLREEFRQAAILELEQWQARFPGQREGDIGATRHFADKLQVGNMLLHGWLAALRVLEAAAQGAHQLPALPPPAEAAYQDPEELAALGGAAGEQGGRAVAAGRQRARRP